MQIQNIDNLPEGVDDDDDWYFDGAVSGDSVQRDGVKQEVV